MREKPVSKKTIGKYIDFLFAVKENALPYECQVSLTEIAINNAINKTAPKALVKLGLIKSISHYRWDWLGESDIDPNKEMALKVLDFLLHMNKKSVPVPILPSYATDIQQMKELLSEIRDNLKKPNDALNGRKSSRIKQPAMITEKEEPFTLFTEADRRFDLMKSLAPAFFNGITEHQNFNEKMIKASEKLIKTTDHLMDKFYDKKDEHFTTT